MKKNQEMLKEVLVDEASKAKHFNSMKRENCWQSITFIKLSFLISLFLFLCFSATALAEDYLWPVPAGTSMSRGYSSSHKGLDITSGGNVVATKSGTVEYVYSGCINTDAASTKINCQNKGCNPNTGNFWYSSEYGVSTCNHGFGNGVVLRHDDGTYSEYAHLSSVNVQKGQKVSQGTVLGVMGSAGLSTGTHLHFAIATQVVISGSYYNLKTYSINNNRSQINYISSAPQAPTSAWMNPSTNQTIYVGDSLTFTYGADQTCEYYLHVCVAGTSNDNCHQVSSSGTTTYTFNNLGTYSVWIGAANSKGSKASNSINVTVQQRTGTLNVMGKLDGSLSSSIEGFGTFDVFIKEGSEFVRKAENITSYSSALTIGTQYEIRNIQAVSGKHYAERYSSGLTGTVNSTGEMKAVLYFTSPGTATEEWIESSYVPANIDADLLDIEYSHHYETTSQSNPGSGWIQGEVISTEYVNNGANYKSHIELPTSATRELVDSYYYHWCSGNTGAYVNYAPTSKYVHYDAITNPSLVTINSTGVDSVDSSYVTYTLKWASDGSWAYCSSGTTCDGSNGSHGNRSYYWYKEYVYQDKTAVNTYKWTKDSGWTDIWDKNATSYIVRYRLKESPHSGEDITEIESEDLISITAGESCQIVYTVTPRNSDVSGITFSSSSPAVIVDSDGTIHANYTSDPSDIYVTIQAPSGVTKNVLVVVNHNIISDNVLIDGHERNYSTIDVYGLNQQVYYTYSYQLSNAYDPNYQVTFTTDPAGYVTQGNGTLQFTRAGVFDLYSHSPYSVIQYGTILVTDPGMSMTLPSQTEEIEEEAFEGIRAKFFYLPNGVRNIGANAFPSGSIIFLNTFNLDTMAADTGAALYVETGSQYNNDFLSRIPNADLYNVSRGTQMSSLKTQYRYRTKETTTSNQSTMSGWTLYDEQAGAWSAWISNGTTPVTATADMEVNSIYHAEQTGITGYNYHRFRYTGSSGVMYTYSESYAISHGGYREDNSVTAANRLPTYKVYDGNQSYGVQYNFWFYEEPVTGVISPAYTEYQYRTRNRTYYFYQWSDWSEWQDEPVTEGENIEVEIREI